MRCSHSTGLVCTVLMLILSLLPVTTTDASDTPHVGEQAMIAMSTVAQQEAGTAGDFPATRPARTSAQLMAEVRELAKEVTPAMRAGKELANPELRKTLAESAAPQMKRILALADEMQSLDAQGARLAPMIRGDLLPVLAAIDEPTFTQLQQDSKGSADLANLLLVAEFIRAGKDEAVQTSVLEKIAGIVRADPSNSSKVRMLNRLQLYSSGQTVSAQIEKASREVAMLRPPGNLVGKPMVIKGTGSDGSQVSTADWKGKVILVDHWATWCGPCVAELPRLKSVYKQYHDKGLEILGVSNDYKLDDLTQFLARDKDMGWPSIIDLKAAANREWNPVTTGYGIDGIPTMFLIDKQGVCRSVTAREDFETMIPKLLAE